MKTEFLKYCKQERREFVNKFIQTKPDTKERVMAEDLLIAYDQLMEQNEEMIDALIKLHRYVKDNQPNYLLSSKYISLHEIESALKKAGVEL